MPIPTSRTSDRIVLFLLFSLSATILIAAIFVLVLARPFEAILHIAGLGGLSAGCLSMFAIILFDRDRPVVTEPTDARAPEDDQAAPVVNELDRAGRSITAG